MTAGQGKFGGRKIREGTVVSDKMEKTVVVMVASNIRHPLYKKTIRRNRHYMVHDENGVAHMGDRVRIVESSPVSKTKRWRLVEVLRQVDLPELAPEDIDLELIGEAKPEAPEPEAVEAAPAPVAESTEPVAEAVGSVEEDAPVAAEEAAPAETESPAEVDAEPAAREAEDPEEKAE
jgi:small subunit ribosomal protein S17